MKEKLGVIDTLSTGFTYITRQLWVLAIPVALDLYLWLGPRLSPSPLIQRMLSYLPSSDPGIQLQELLAGFNLFSLLVSAILGVPSLISGETSLASPWRALVIEVDNGLLLLAWLLILLPTGLFLGCLYLGLITRKVQGGQERFIGFLRRVGRYWLRVVVLILLFIGGVLLLGIPSTVVLTLASLLSENLVAILSALFLAVALWIGFYLFFVIDAIVISDVGPIRAIWNSINVVRRNLWSALGLVILINIIAMGLPYLWRALTATPWGTALGILGNAYVGSGLVAASLIFYRDRYRAWVEEKSDSRKV